MSLREDELRTWANSEDWTERSEAADAADLPIALMRKLIHDREEQVLTALVTNCNVPREVLDEARVLRPEIESVVAEHPNAPFDLAEPKPLWQHTYLSITSYCRAKGLSEAIRDRIAMTWSDMDPSNGITLAESIEAAR